MGASNVKGIWTCFVFIICLFLALMPGNAKALPFADSDAYIDWESLEITMDPGLEIRFHDVYVNDDDNRHISYSEAYARLEDVEEQIDQKSASTWVDTEADADITGTMISASAKTKADQLYSSAYAEVDGPGSESRAWAGAERWVYFTVDAGSGTIKLTADYEINQEVGVNTVNDYASAYSSAWLELYKKTSERTTLSDYDWPRNKETLEGVNNVTRGDGDSGTMEAILDYSAGDTGYMWMGVYSKAKVKTQEAPVPEPTTMLLLGCGLIGLAGLRKKFKK